MKAIVMTYPLAMAASRDAGNRSMRKALRTQWNDEDYNIAVATLHRMYPCPDPRCEMCAPRWAAVA